MANTKTNALTYFILSIILLTAAILRRYTYVFIILAAIGFIVTLYWLFRDKIWISRESRDGWNRIKYKDIPVWIKKERTSKYPLTLQDGYKIFWKDKDTKYKCLCLENEGDIYFSRKQI